jgi:phosphatidylserine/phosphatidylglycerophosphate/cardiolipin synthase-like enzyme
VASFADGKIEAYVGPVELGASDNLEQVIVDFIAGAKKSLDIAIQEIDSRAIAQAVLDARWRGVRVQMFIDGRRGQRTSPSQRWRCGPRST